jgi:hypothetical protein
VSLIHPRKHPQILDTRTVGLSQVRRADHHPLRAARRRLDTLGSQRPRLQLEAHRGDGVAATGLKRAEHDSATSTSRDVLPVRASQPDSFVT